MRLFGHFLSKPVALVIATDTISIGLVVLGVDFFLSLFGVSAVQQVKLLHFFIVISIAMMFFYIIIENHDNISPIEDNYSAIQIIYFSLVRSSGLFIIYYISSLIVLTQYADGKTDSLFIAATFFALVGCSALLSGRVFVSRIFGFETFKPRVLVLGDGEDARALQNLLVTTTRNRCDPHFWPDTSSFTSPGACSLLDLVTREKFAEIVITSAPLEEALSKQLLECKFSGIRISNCCSFYERIARRIDLTLVKTYWLVCCDGFHQKLQARLKRTLDIVASLLLLIVALPIGLTVALAIKLESPGKVFFTQDRIGLNGRRFRMLKFRSMRSDISGPAWTAEGDRRITTVGKWIRRFRFDEIPQIYNVLTGTMSIVGPRPEQPDLVVMLDAAMPHYHERHRVKPGITGWAQVNFTYGASIEDARMKLSYDLYYIKNYSVLLDVLIMMKTIRVLLMPGTAR